MHGDRGPFWSSSGLSVAVGALAGNKMPRGDLATATLIDKLLYHVGSNVVPFVHSRRC